MKKTRLFLLLTLWLLVHTSYGQEISYSLRMSNPQNHYFQVEMKLKNFKEKVLELKMPVWAPGSYLVREFSKNVDLVKAVDEKGNPLRVKKKTKNTWEILKEGAKEVRVNYEVYAFELSVRTSFLDLTHGYVSGSGVFMYINKHKELSGQLEVFPHATFHTISTALPTKGTESTVFTFNHYDQLIDCPIEIGNQEVFSFTAAGVNHTVAMYGKGNYSIETLKGDMAKIVEAETAVFGENPNKDYTFIVHNVVNGQGGLEHMNSTTLSVNRWTYQGDEYLDFLNLVAHEYFHLWNVKRIRPVELGPFNYDEENYTTLLWVMEGFTSYYDELLMLRAGYYTKDQFLTKMQSSINYVEGSVGARVQPVAHASFDAWIKAYRPNENSGNTTMTYYSRGSMLAALLDVKIIEKYKGKKCLDHFMQQLYTKFYKGMNRGFSEEEFQRELEAFLGENLTDFFAKYVHGTEIAPLNEVFSKVGLSMQNTSKSKPSFGAGIAQESGKVMVRSVRSLSSAEDAGLSVNDEIVGCNGYRVEKEGLEEFIAGLDSGTSFKLLISRDLQLMELTVVLKPWEKPQFSFKLDSTPEKDNLRNYWLR